MASAGRDKKLAIWDMTSKSVVAEQTGPEVMTSLAWQPEGNCLAGLDEAGKSSCWQQPVPADKPSPSAALDTLDLNAPILGSKGMSTHTVWYTNDVKALLCTHWTWMLPSLATKVRQFIPFGIPMMWKPQQAGCN